MRPQADALGQNLPGGAISSAVEHLPYKEIVTGSIPVSPISPPKPFQCKGFSGPKGSLFLWQIALDLADLARILARFSHLPISKGFSPAGRDSLWGTEKLKTH